MTNWLTSVRVQIIASLLACINLLVVAALWITSHAGRDGNGTALGPDFLALWSAGWVALQGSWQNAMGSVALSTIHPLAPAGQLDVLLWTYPPPILLILAPLAHWAYVPALLLFTALSLAVGVLALRQFRFGKLGWLIWLGAPATLVCVLGGQTGILLAALAALGLWQRTQRPLLGGLLLGLLCLKPHFAVLVPIFLLLQRDYKCLTGFILSSALLAIASYAAFGPAPWQLFFTQLESARTILEQGAPPWAKMASVFVSAKLLGVSTQLAWVLHGLAALLAVWLAWPALRQWGHLATAALVFLTLAVAPYQFDYDQSLALVGIAFWLSAKQGNWLKGEQTTLAILWLGPLLFPFIADPTHIGLAPLANFAALYCLRQRAISLRVASPTG